jgi:hypothetical protein
MGTMGTMERICGKEYGIILGITYGYKKLKGYEFAPRLMAHCYSPFWDPRALQVMGLNPMVC